MNAEELKERTKQFALRIMHLVDALPKSAKTRAIANQIIRSGTSVSRIGIVEEEADETALWLELIVADKILPNKKVLPLLDEANELVAIMATSFISARNNGSPRPISRKSAISNQQSAIKS